MLRGESGDWEVDLVVSAKAGQKSFTRLIERVTRFQHITILSDKSKKGVAKALNRLKHQYGTKQFRDVFKTITCDNGPEFLNCHPWILNCQPWNAPAAVPSREPGSIMPTLFPLLNVAATKTLTDSYAVSCLR